MSPGKRMRRTLVASLMLVAFASRAFVTPGFMPAKGRPFLLEICAEDLPAVLLAPANASSADSMDMASMDTDAMPAENSATTRVPPPGLHHHGESSSHGDHCVFGSVCLAGPIPHLPPISRFSCARPPRAVAPASIAVAIRVVHLPQPRAPPSRLS